MVEAMNGFSEKHGEEIKITVLEGEQCLELRSLWEDVFYEDSKEFTDYYFEEKVTCNRAFVIQTDPQTKYRAMVHLSPYAMKIRVSNEFACLQLNYIVGVATAGEYRHRGYMGRLLEAAFRYMYEEKQPFTFLMPANPKIYEPFQFVYIYDRDEYEVKAGRIKTAELQAAELQTVTAEHTSWKTAVLKKKEIPQLISFANLNLEKNYDVFMQRNAAYYETMVKELQVQNGAVYLIHGSCGADKEDKGNMEGYFLYTEEAGKADIQEAVLPEKTQLPVRKKNIRTPAIMARIINVRAMLSLLRTENKEVMLTILITDPLLKENCGVWTCRIGKESSVSNKENGEEKAECMISVERLTSWIFGYRKEEECFDFPRANGNSEILCKLKSVNRLQRVFINEIV